MPSVSFVERHVKVLGPVIGAEAARTIAHRNALRAAALIVALLAFLPAGTWAQMAGGPLAWSTATLTLASTVGLFAVSVVFGHRAEASANAFVGQQLGFPVRLGSNLDVEEFRRAIEREKFFHAQGHRPRWGIYHAPKDSR
jgi:hypothetical protein